MKHQMMPFSISLFSFLTVQRALFIFGNWLRQTGQQLDRAGCALSGTNAPREQISPDTRVVPLYDLKASVGSSTFVAPNAALVGAPRIGKNSAIWYGVMIRADVNKVRIGDNTSIGDRSTVHVAREGVRQTGFATAIGNNVYVGPGSLIHGATLEDDSFVESGCSVLDGAVVGKGSKVEAGSLVLSGTLIPAGQLWAGTPARFVRNLTEEEMAANQTLLSQNIELANRHGYWHSLKPQERAKLTEESLSTKPPVWHADLL